MSTTATVSLKIDLADAFELSALSKTVDGITSDLSIKEIGDLITALNYHHTIKIDEKALSEIVPDNLYYHGAQRTYFLAKMNEETSCIYFFRTDKDGVPNTHEKFKPWGMGVVGMRLVAKQPLFLEPASSVISKLTLVPGKKLPANFSDASKLLTRPYLKISLDQYDQVVSLASNTDILLYKGVQVTFGDADGGKVLMPLSKPI